MKAFRRARRPEQKDLRRAQLLATARAMLQGGTALEELGLNELARRAKMTKSNVYRYFESREHVLLALLQEEWGAWFATLTSSWRDPPKKTPPLRHLADAIARSLAHHPLLCQLTSALPSVLERNLSEDALCQFKRALLTFLDQAAVFIVDKVPSLSTRSAVQWMHDGTALVTGLWPYANPAPAVVRVLAAHEDLRPLARDFTSDLSRLLYAVAVDLGADAGAAPAKR